ncbi:type VII toxin-antitoxin system HepT family RNase toxin [Paramaledivibacter caminithermalis]|jgi:uncharacterized protein YutE (UPF0331/DUF86 family)|uniref:Uncharacterized conserved protein YutE, UPF0331/DUF86 family n=1 Tax=Paramaledivibacter caminithermalis (strain DSM 15212 / CIP 107654 / DViRD3) TaxID=1121301 RepID=A0A1M6QTU0_PARC5|nr:DUF86 domain-containing protein [Paramaledivibacter caminithermalis]SHK23530.1 Uncharacterized conserved protein YutE, UPF0331/DUF86 family [Paramaledivibacter caminithermalis DSM 15212]
MVKIEVLQNRLEQLDVSIKKIRRYVNLSLEEFLEDDIVQDVVEYNLFIAINMMIDIAVHIVVDNNLGKINTMGEAFEILYKEKYISKDEMLTYKNMVAFRNILSHEYVKIDKKMVYAIMQKNLIDFDKFILFINDNFI